MSTRQKTGIIGSAVLIVSVFLPILSVPIFGDFNLFQNGHGDGTILLGAAVLSMIFIAIDCTALLWVTGFGSLGVTIFDLVNVVQTLSNAKGELDGLLAGNMFKGLAEVALSSVQLQWGWAVAILGGCLLLVAAAISEPEDASGLELDRSSSVPSLVLVLIGVVGLGGLVYMTLDGGQTHARSASESTGSVATRIKTRLQAEADLRRLSIEITEDQGEITLSGTVPNDFVRGKIDTLAREIAGAETVHDEMELAARPPEENRPLALLPDGGNREQRLIDALCGNALDTQACMEKEIPGWPNISPLADPSDFSNQEAFNKARAKCTPLFANDTSMLVYCLGEVYNGLILSQESPRDRP